MTVRELFVRLCKSIPSGFVLVFVFSFTASSSFALTNPQRYYDWGPYYTGLSSQVLGVSVASEQPQSSPPAQFRGVQDVAQFKGYFLGFGSGMNPGNPLYFLKKAQESLVLGLTFDPAKKQALQIQIAGARLAELEKLAQDGQSELVVVSSDDYQKSMAVATAALNRSDSNSTEVQKQLQRIDEESAKHALVLEQVLAKATDSTKAELTQALAAAAKVLDTVADLAGKAALPLEVLDRIQALKSQGLLSPEEAQKLVSLTSRVEARQELQKFADEGIFPPADINKLDELAKTKYAQTYNQVVELKKFQELKKFEGEKPSPEILNKVQEFAKNYKAGDQVPPDLRRYWVPLVRLEELQNTIRPDLIDENALKSQTEDYKKYQEVVARLKPRPEDLAQLEKLVGQNPNFANDPFYQRVTNLAGKFGTGENSTQVPGVPATVKSCPGNSHWAGLPYVPEGGYCVPNITYAPYQSQPVEGENKTTATRESVCPSKYHRNYPGGPCVPDAYFGSPVSYPTYTPGGYPSPVYPPAGCPNGYYWSGTICLNQSSNETSRADHGNSFEPKPEMGNCRTPGECHDWCKANPGKCSGFNPDSPRPAVNSQPNNLSRETQEVNCKAGGGICVNWMNGACSCERSQVSGQSSGTGSNNSQVYNSPGSPSRESQEWACRSGGGICVSWVNGACGCERPGQTNWSAGSSNPDPGSTPPSGYGTCSSSQYWNGSSCQNNTYTPPSSSETPEQPCLRGTNCSWTGSSCNCSSFSPSPSPEPSPTPTPTPAPTDSGGGSGSSCSSGQYWNGSACVSGQ